MSKTFKQPAVRRNERSNDGGKFVNKRVSKEKMIQRELDEEIARY